MKWTSLLSAILCAASSWGYAQSQRTLVPLESGYLVVEVWQEGLVHFEAGTGTPPPIDQALWRSPLIDPDAAMRDTMTTVTTHTIETAHLRIVVNPQSQCVAIDDLQRNYALPTVCLEDLTQAWKGWRLEAANYTHIYGLGQNFLSEDTVDPNLATHKITPGPFGNELRGFAGGATAVTQLPIVYFLGDGLVNAGLFMNHVYKQEWDFSSRPWRMRTWGDQLRWFAIAGPNIDSLRKKYLHLTGKPPLLGLNKFGYWMSEFGYDRWLEVDRHLSNMRNAALPLDGFSMDLQWYGGRFGEPDTSRMGSLTWDTEAFPAPLEKITAYRDEGIDLMLIEQPYVAENLPEHAALAERGFLVKDCERCAPTYIDHNPWWGRGGMIDFTNPQANAFWHQYRRSVLVETYGITNHWCDLGEPEMYNDNAWYFGLPDLALHQQGDVHNIYNLSWARGIVAAYAASGSNLRPFILTRSGTSGSQRYYTALWSGDIGANLTSMNAHYRSQVHMSLAGIDYYGADMGGFYRPALDGDESELVTRWFANGLMTDVPARSHVWNIPGQYSSDPTEVGDLASHRHHLHQRYRLIPYLYSLARQASETGAPLLPPPLYYAQEDTVLRSMTDQKFIGKDLMVALATQYGEAGRSVYLPPGRWTWTDGGAVFALSKSDWIKFPLFPAGHLQLPIFVRAGAILPVSTTESPRNAAAAMSRVGVDVYPGRTATQFPLYVDDGSTTGYQSGAYRLENWRQHWRTNNEVEVSGHLAHTDTQFDTVRNDRTIRLVMPDHKVTEIRRDGATLPACQSHDDTDCVTSEAGHPAARIASLSTDAPTTGAVVFHVEPVETATARVYLSCKHGGETPTYAVGSVPALGNWIPEQAVALQRLEDHSWGALVDGLAAGATVEWKCITIKDSQVVWQPGPNNKTSELPTGWAGYFESQW